jgi:putative NADH-flavin reductase
MEIFMKTVLIGATGYVGSAVLEELLDRGHDVTAVVRKPERLPAHARLKAASADVFDATSVSHVVAGHDAVISAYSPGHADPDLYRHHVAAMGAIIDGVARSDVRRLLVVGGAGTLEIAPGRQLIDSPDFPSQWKPTASATRESLNLLKHANTLRWTFLAPAAHLEPGERTGKYRVADGQLLVDASGESRISVQDYAVAMVDELEHPQHERRLFNVAY